MIENSLRGIEKPSFRERRRPSFSRTVRYTRFSIYFHDNLNTVRWDPDAVLHNYRWVVPVVVPVDRIRRPVIPSVMHKNKICKRIKERERKRGKEEEKLNDILYIYIHA